MRRAMVAAALMSGTAVAASAAVVWTAEGGARTIALATVTTLTDYPQRAFYLQRPG